MTAEEAVKYIENYTWSTTRLGLDRTRALLAALGDPQKKLKFIHVTGSNGKGSTCALLDSVLRKAGYRTGLYTSPYICEFAERIRINGNNITDEALAVITERVRTIADAMEDHPSQFELVTAIAMEYFFESKCDIVVLEVGMGGALDSTNAIDAPEVAAFTNIGLEHTEYLGSTIEAIAETKGGIIKPGCNVVVYDTDMRAVSTLSRICMNLRVPMRVIDPLNIRLLSHSLEGQEVIRYYRKTRFDKNTSSIKLHLPLLGEHQLHNLNLALEILEVLKLRGWSISEEAVTEGVLAVRWAARFEILDRNPLFILDGGHNPQCAEAMAAILKDYLPDSKVTFLMGVLADKDYHTMLNTVCPHAARFVCVTPDSPRALSAEALAKVINELGFEAQVCNNIPEAIQTARSFTEPVIAFGSLYMSGTILKEFGKKA